ncbi:hypothetical protein [Nitrosomonas cryotolerans]|uniref:hypothetical protein n=1 Tax=Nitrosomonas cryotolerans TaxID=44575 RepID=UPI00048AF702|nr:hypothetical protein [Nitrosomonas cryotolerans]
MFNHHRRFFEVSADLSPASLGIYRIKFNNRLSFNPKIRSLERLPAGNTMGVEMDNTSRILMSLLLRQFADLSKNTL